jgi:hypothetical protein
MHAIQASKERMENVNRELFICFTNQELCTACAKATQEQRRTCAKSEAVTAAA